MESRGLPKPGGVSSWGREGGGKLHHAALFAGRLQNTTRGKSYNANTRVRIFGGYYTNTISAGTGGRSTIL